MRSDVEFSTLWCHFSAQKVWDFEAVQILDFQIRVADSVLSMYRMRNKVDNELVRHSHLQNIENTNNYFLGFAYYISAKCKLFYNGKSQLKKN
jgi:hypothetical protein